MAESFTQTLVNTFPEGVTLDPKLAKTFDWMEAQGWLVSYNFGDRPVYYMPIYPPDVHQLPNASLVSFGGTTVPYTGHWSTPKLEVDNRIVEIASTSGDGGRAAIWIDDAGEQWFVHLGHDSTGVIGKDPVDFLQFLAMGYLEPGALDRTNVTPQQEVMEYYGYENASEFEADEGPTLVPEAFQDFLKAEFGVTPPATARDLGIADFDYYGDEKSTDPFVQWMIKVTPPPTEEELAYIRELTKMAEEMNLDDLMLDEPEPPKGVIGKLKGLFGLQ